MRGAGDVGDQAAGPARVQRDRAAAPVAAGPAASTSPGDAATALSGRRRRAPRPVHGTSTRTRSNDPVARPAACRRRRRTSPRHGAQRLGDQPSAVRLPLAASSRAPRSRGERGEQGRLAAGTGAQVEPPLVRPVDGRPGSAPARPAAIPRPARRPVPRAPPAPRRIPESHDGQRRADRRGRACGSATAAAAPRPSPAPAEPPASPAAVRCRRPAAAGSSSGRSSASASASTTQAGCEVRTGSGASSASIHPARSRAAIRRITALVKPAGLWPTRARTQLDGAGHRGVVGHPHRQQLVGAEPQRVAHSRGRVGGRRGGRAPRRTSPGRAGCPPTSSVANAASRPVMPRSRSSPGRTRLA